MSRQRLKRVLPAWMLNAYRASWRKRHERTLLASMTPHGRRLYKAASLSTYDSVRLQPIDELARSCVQGAARDVYGDQWNFYSDALRLEVVDGFVRTIDAMANSERIDYLEVGSCQGVSMSLIGTLLRERGKIGALTSVDP